VATRTLWDVQDMLVSGYSEPQAMMRPSRVPPEPNPWWPFDAAVKAAHEAVSTGEIVFEQDVWWTNGEGITRLIDDMTVKHRLSVASGLVRSAARFYAERERLRVWAERIAYEAWATDSWRLPGARRGGPNSERQLREDIDSGKHIEWLQSTPLFQKMAQGFTIKRRTS
jgi:hypothetical protein